VPLLGPAPMAAAGVICGVRIAANWLIGVVKLVAGCSGTPLARLAAFADNLLLRRCNHTTTTDNYRRHVLPNLVTTILRACSFQTHNSVLLLQTISWWCTITSSCQQQAKHRAHTCDIWTKQKGTQQQTSVAMHSRITRDAQLGVLK
jgi:hypothetical protein